MMTQRNLLLISSSYARDGSYLAHCWDALRNFYSASGNKHILFVPYANAYDWQGFVRECTPNFESNGIKIKSILDYEHPQDALSDKDLAGVFMAGGNTFKLLKWLHEYKLVDAIRQRTHEGLPYTGVSAGAIVACPGIYTTNDMPMTEPKSLKALDLVPFQVNPHFVLGELIAKHHGETREQRIQQFHTEHKIPVIGLPEGSRLEVHDDSMVLGGKDTAALFEANEETITLTPGNIGEPALSRLLNFSNVKSKLG